MQVNKSTLDGQNLHDGSDLIPYFYDRLKEVSDEDKKIRTIMMLCTT